MPDEKITFNGVDPSGQYLTAPLSAQELAAIAQEEFAQTTKQERAAAESRSTKITEDHLDFYNINLENLKQARWGVIFGKDEDDKVKQAVEPLIKHRADSLGIQIPVLEYHPGMSDDQFLVDHGVEPGIGQVEKVPYYLLIVGDPTRIPFHFEYGIGSEYGVGRLSFETAEGYTNYIERLMDYETSTAVPTSKRALFWGTTHADDTATSQSAQLLVKPLHKGLDPQLGYQAELYLAEQAQKDVLGKAVSSAQAPSLLFTASHGLAFRNTDQAQSKRQGALITQEWNPGAPVTSVESFGGADISAASNVRGMVHFAFACYSAGTPSPDDFGYGKNTRAPIVAANPFVAELARRELEQGALAFIGHIERAWGYSYFNRNQEPSIEAFRNAVDRILRGIPVGHALRTQRDAAVRLDALLLKQVSRMLTVRDVEPVVIAELWKERNDARGFTVVGDPAARVRLHS